MPEQFITVLTFLNPVELAIVRGRLESEGIECLVQDELTAQVFYSTTAIGGIKLQVKEKDIEKAIEILKELGYITDKDLQPSKVFVALDKWTAKIPLIKKLRVEFRLTIISIILAGLLFGIIYAFILPSTYERLTANNWCVDYITYGGKNYTTQTEYLLTLAGAGLCEEEITFRENSRIVMPGLVSRPVYGYWKLENGMVQILQVDSFAHIYNGLYKIEFANKSLVLTSEKTTLHCHTEHFYFNFPSSN